MDKNYVISKVIKHYKLPIPQLPDLYEYFIDLYDDMFGTKSILNTVLAEIQNNDEHEYFSKLRETRQAVIDAIKDREAFKEFNDQTNPYFFCKKGGDIPLYCTTSQRFKFTKRNDVYQEKNDGAYFVSIDMEKANFQILRKYNEDIVLGAKTYDELIKMFSDSKYFTSSKYLRQVLFGQLAPSRQCSMQKYFTGQILETLIDEALVKEELMRVYTHDELVFSADGFVSEKFQNDIKSCIRDKFGFEMHVDGFKLSHVYNTSYAKEYTDGSYELKSVPQHLYPQIYKKYRGIEINKNDLAFIFEGEKACFEKTIDGKILA